MCIRWEFILLSFTLSCLSCSYNLSDDQQTLEGIFLGAKYEIQYLDTINHQTSIDSLLKAIASEISIADSQAIIHQFNAATFDFDLGISLADTLFENYSRGRHFLNCFVQAIHFFELSDGVFDPTLKPVLDYWSNRTHIFSTPIDIRDSLMIDSLLQYVGLSYLTFEDTKLIKDQSEMQMDFELMIKGYAIDQIGAWLTLKGIDNYLITIDGFVRAKGRNKNGAFWSTHFPLPTKNLGQDSLLTTVQLPMLSFAQVNNNQAFKIQNSSKYPAIINTLTGFPVSDSLISTTVFFEDCTTATTLAHTCMAMGYEQAVSFIEAIPGTEAYFIYRKKQGQLGVKKTAGLSTLLQRQAAAGTQ